MCIKNIMQCNVGLGSSRRKAKLSQRYQVLVFSGYSSKTSVFIRSRPESRWPKKTEFSPAKKFCGSFANDELDMAIFGIDWPFPRNVVW